MMVYIAGPMTGLPDHGWVAFSRAESKLTGLGYTVISPEWMTEELPRKSCLPIRMAMIDQCDAIVLLDGWEQSKGARIERDYAEYCGKAVYELEQLLGKGRWTDGA